MLILIYAVQLISVWAIIYYTIKLSQSTLVSLWSREEDLKYQAYEEAEEVLGKLKISSATVLARERRIKQLETEIGELMDKLAFYRVALKKDMGL